jgi:hypothetical protein
LGSTEGFSPSRFRSPWPTAAEFTYEQDGSIFQSKDDPETGFSFQHKMILKSDEEEAASRPTSFLEFWV